MSDRLLGYCIEIWGVAGSLKLPDTGLFMERSRSKAAAYARDVAVANPGQTVLLRRYTEQGVRDVASWTQPAQEAVD
jgi:hypothetical protein